VFVIDSSDTERIEDAAKELERMISELELQQAVLLVIANKKDMPNSMSVNEISVKLRLQQQKGREWFIQSACATTGDGLYEGLDWLASVLSSKQ